MSEISAIARFTAQAIANEAATTTGAHLAQVKVHVQESFGAHPAVLVYVIELLRSGDTSQLECSATNLEELTEAVNEAVLYSRDLPAVAD